MLVPDNYTGDEGDKEEDNNFEPDGSDISLGQEDKDINDDELANLEGDAAANNIMAKSMKSICPKVSGSAKKKAAVDDITEHITRMSVAPVINTTIHLS